MEIVRTTEKEDEYVSLELGRALSAHQILEGSGVWSVKSVAVAVWVSGPDGAGVFPVGQCRCHLSGQAAHQLEDSHL